MEFEKQKPITDAYRRGWERIWGRELYEERAAIKEFAGNLSRDEAERQAKEEVDALC